VRLWLGLKRRTGGQNLKLTCSNGNDLYGAVAGEGLQDGGRLSSSSCARLGIMHGLARSKTIDHWEGGDIEILFVDGKIMGTY
jgi:hypothetical protein